jgi:hypothetical protein
MTALALVLAACEALGIREPMEFYALSDSAQDLWIEHARNKQSGAYDRRPKRARPDATNHAAVEAECIERMSRGAR